MYQITTTEKKLATIVEGIVYSGLFTSEKKERRDLAKVIAKEALSKTFENEYEAKRFIYDRAFKDTMDEEIEEIATTIEMLKSYVLTGKMEGPSKAWEPLEPFLEEIEDLGYDEYEDEEDLHCNIECLVYSWYGYRYCNDGSWRFEGYIRSSL